MAHSWGPWTRFMAIAGKFGIHSYVSQCSGCGAQLVAAVNEGVPSAASIAYVPPESAVARAEHGA